MPAVEKCALQAALHVADVAQLADVGVGLDKEDMFQYWQEGEGQGETRAADGRLTPPTISPESGNTDLSAATEGVHIPSRHNVMSTTPAKRLWRAQIAPEGIVRIGGLENGRKRQMQYP